MNQEELDRLRENNATKIATEIYNRKIGYIMSEFASGRDVVRLYIDRGTLKFNYQICDGLDKLLTQDGLYCEYVSSMGCNDCIVKIYPEKPKRNWWQKIFS